MIKIVLEGFKNYGQMTMLEAFEPRFSVITGRNGSGKSNILDALLFLLRL